VTGDAAATLELGGALSAELAVMLGARRWQAHARAARCAERLAVRLALRGRSLMGTPVHADEIALATLLLGARIDERPAGVVPEPLAVAASLGNLSASLTALGQAHRAADQRIRRHRAMVATHRALDVAVAARLFAVALGLSRDETLIGTGRGARR
jgi:hypothetical protein